MSADGAARAASLAPFVCPDCKGAGCVGEGSISDPLRDCARCSGEGVLVQFDGGIRNLIEKMRRETPIVTTVGDLEDLAAHLLVAERSVAWVQNDPWGPDARHQHDRLRARVRAFLEGLGLEPSE